MKHPGSGATTIVSVTGDDADADETRGVSDSKSSRFSKKEINAQDLLKSKGFIPIKWTGKCEADKVSIGSHDIRAGQTGMYGLVFDNTFSKQTSKSATFVILTYPTGAPPQTSSHLPNLQARSSQTSLGKHGSPKLDDVASASLDSLHSQKARGRGGSVSGRSDGGPPGNYHVGSLSKRRRKKGQGYARRFFSLDYSTCTLSYYYNRNSSALRGAIPLSLAAVAADERRREISIDSGAEVWHLKAPNAREFQEWARALEKASRIARGLEALDQPARPDVSTLPRLLQPINKSAVTSSPQEDREWQQVETLVSRIVGTRDALRRLTREVAVQATQPKPPSSPQYLSPNSASAIEDNDTYFTPAEKRPFWRRKSSTPAVAPSTLVAPTVAALAVTSPGSVTTTISAHDAKTAKRRSKGAVQEENSLHDHCQALLSDLDSVVAEFTSLIGNSKRRRLPIPQSAGGASRLSIDTMSTAEEFFDAEDAVSGVVKIDGSEDESPGSDADEASLDDTSSVSSMGEEDDGNADDVGHLWPSKPKSLGPLPIEQSVTRRTGIPPATVPPPSLIGFVRKNVGKDLSTISMPVSSNEPFSMLQKVAEQLEYAQLLNQATKQSTAEDRLLFVTAFAVSQFSSARAKERAMRKPFNPLLGETYELVRTEKETPGGFRLLAEKVCHRPVKIAIHADSAKWSFSQSPIPGQKFWGKSAEITTEGRVRIVLRLPNGSDERYSWNIATMFLRNVVMGEKYVEPVGNMHVMNDSTGHKASVEFKSKGMFGGRSEDVVVEILNAEGQATNTGLTGTWTSGLKTTGKGGGEDIWKVGSLVDNAPQTYGFTTFAASLNEMTEVEKGKLPPTDCRLRQDQRFAEEGQLDDAEEWKHKLEEAQRARRRDMEERGDEHKPKWFVRAETAPEGEEVWKIKSGKDGYWDERAKGTWQGVERIFEIE